MAALIALMGCVSYTTSPSAPSPAVSVDPGGSSPVPQAEYEKRTIVFKNRIVDEEESSLYRVRYIRFPSYGDNGQEDNLVTGRYYESKRPGRKSAIIGGSGNSNCPTRPIPRMPVKFPVIVQSNVIELKPRLS